MSKSDPLAVEGGSCSGGDGCCQPAPGNSELDGPVRICDGSPAEANRPPEPITRGEGLLRALEMPLLALERWILRALPPSLNPLGNAGAIANTCLIVAVLTGVVLLIWYSPSVHQAHASLEALRQGSFLGQLTRSLHRYSSDACLFFIVLHAYRVFVSRRFSGARWLAWTTGVGLLGLVWFIGWTGYWLVWDAPAQHVAVGSAKLLDALPIFGDPLARSFLTDRGVPSLIFFLVFFTHMLLPLVVGIGLWLHLSRISRPKLITNRVLTIWILGALIVWSVVIPATSAQAAEMTVKAQRFSMDWWYLWPIALTDRLGSGALWALFLGGSIVFTAVPWLMVKRRRPVAQVVAAVNLDQCNGCTLCSRDCPFDAIIMQKREDGANFLLKAEVDPDRCVGCGICVGACEPGAINLPWLNAAAERLQMETWTERQAQGGKRPLLAYVCAESAGRFLTVGSDGLCPDLPGYRVRTVPCTGWVNARLIEAAFAKGAAGVLVIGCGAGEPNYREGSQWLTDRLSGERKPRLRERRAIASRVRHLSFDRGQIAALRAEAAAFRGERERAIGLRSGPVGAAVMGLACVALIGLVVVGGSILPYRTPHDAQPELVFSFRQFGERAAEGRAPTAEEMASRPVHMRAKVVDIDRSRAPVRVQLHVDGELMLDRNYPARGLKSDGPAVGVERFRFDTGAKLVSVRMAVGGDPEQWSAEWEELVELVEGRVRVVLFDPDRGFSLD
jgi:ferredoxin/coenzyme F420-reducing hydrogenase delta subunit